MNINFAKNNVQQLIDAIENGEISLDEVKELLKPVLSVGKKRLHPNQLVGKKLKITQHFIELFTQFMEEEFDEYPDYDLQNVENLATLIEEDAITSTQNTAIWNGCDNSEELHQWKAVVKMEGVYVLVKLWLFRFNEQANFTDLITLEVQEHLEDFEQIKEVYSLGDEKVLANILVA